MAEERGTDPEQDPIAIHPQDIATRLAAYRRRATPTATTDVIIDLTAAESDVVWAEAPNGAIVVLPDPEPERGDDA